MTVILYASTPVVRMEISLIKVIQLPNKTDLHKNKVFRDHYLIIIIKKQIKPPIS